MGTCSKCGKKCEGSQCFLHKPRKPLKSGPKKPKSYSRDEMLQVFRKVFNERGKKSEISGKHLGSLCLSSFVHHILPKSKYPDAVLDEENLILLTPEEHEVVENDMLKYDEINRRRMYLLEKYDIS